MGRHCKGGRSSKSVHHSPPQHIVQGLASQHTSSSLRWGTSHFFFLGQKVSTGWILSWVLFIPCNFHMEAWNIARYISSKAMDYLVLTCRPKVSIIYRPHFLVANLHRWAPSRWQARAVRLASQHGYRERDNPAARHHFVLCCTKTEPTWPQIVEESGKKGQWKILPENWDCWVLEAIRHDSSHHFAIMTA